MKGVLVGLRLTDLEFDSEGYVIAGLDSGTPKGRVTAAFEVDWSNGIIGALPEPDVFAEFPTSVPQIRRIVRAVVSFYAAAKDVAPPSRDTLNDSV